MTQVRLACAALALVAISGCEREKTARAQAAGCADGELRDGDACVPEACGVGTYGNLGETPYTVGPEGAFDTIQDALDAAGADGGALVAVAAGTYAETLTITRDHGGVTLAGRCREMVTVDGADGDAKAALFAAKGTGRTEFAVDNITFANATGTGVHAEGLTIALHRLRVTAAGSIGVNAAGYGTQMTVDDLEIDTMNAESGPAEGFAVFDGASVTAQALRVHDVPSIAVDVLGTAATLHVTDCTIHNVAEGPDHVGVAFRVADSGTLTAEKCDIFSTVGEAIYVADDTSVATLTDSTVHDLLPSTKPALPGWGAYVGTGGTFVSQRNAWTRTAGAISTQKQGTATSTGDVFKDSIYVGAYSTGADARLTLTDCEMDGVTLFERANAYGYGVAAIEGGETDVSNCVITNAVGGGALAQGDGASLTLRNADISFSGTAHADPPGYNGIAVAERATAVVEDTAIHDVIGTLAGANDATLTMRRVALLDSDPAGGISSGMGVHVWNHGVVNLEDVSVEHMHSVGMVAQTDGTIHLDGVSVSDTDADAAGGGGIGVFVENGLIDGRDLHIARTHGMGVDAQGSGVIRVDTVDISDTLASTYYAGGVAVAALGGTISLTDATLRESDGVGLWSTENGALTCAGCTIDGARFAGAAVRGGEMVLSDTNIRGIVSDDSFGGGVGLYGRQEFGVGSLFASGVTVEAAPYAGAWFQGAGEWTVSESTLAGGSGVALRENLIMHGNAVFAADGAEPALAHDTLHDATIGVLLDNAGASLADISWAANTLDFRAQSCVDDAPAAPDGATVAVCPEDAVLTLRFDYNLVPVDVTGESE